MPRQLIVLLIFVVCSLGAAQAQSSADADCGCEITLPADVLAIVRNVRITTKDVDALIADRISSLQQQIVAARQRELDLQINSRLLDAEAKKRGISATKLIDEVILSAVKPPTEAEAQAFYEQNKERIKAAFSDVKNDLTAYLLQQRQRDEAGRFARQLREAAQVKVLAPHPTPPESAAERARVFAVVNGQSVTSGDVEDSLQPLIYQVQDEIYRLRQTELNLKINDTLLGQEAQQRGITPQALLDAEVMAKVTKATESEARAFYDQNRERLNGDFAALKSQIIDYLSQQAENRASAAFAAQLRQKAAVQIFLTAPVLPKGLLTTDEQPVLGSDRAAVTIIEFTDYECQSCAQTQPVLERLLKEYEGRVKLVVRDFPLAQHAQAFLAAEAAEAARAQGRYQEYHKLLFQHQAKLSPDELRALATQLGLDRKKFDAALESHQYAALVQRDLEDGNRIGINATPSLFINGRRVSDRSYEALKAAIEAALKEVNGTTQ